MRILRLRLSTRWVIALWLLTRGVMVLLTAVYFQGDCATYFRQGRLWLDGQIPYRDYPVEYPPAPTAIFALLALAGDAVRFRVVFIALMLLLDAVCVRLLLRHDQAGRQGPRPPTQPGWDPAEDTSSPSGAFTFVLATALLFPVLYVRFDLMPATACLAGLLLLAQARAPCEARVAALIGAALGLAIALKLYPLMLIPLLLLYWRRARLGRRSGALAVATSLVVVAASFLPVWLAGAGSAVFGFLQYQSERGLQIESSYAGLLLLANRLMPFGLAHQSTHSAHDVVGPGVQAITAMAKVLQPLAILMTTAVVYRRRVSLLPACAAVITAGVVTANVFSPQFLIWIFPLAALAGGRARGGPGFYLVSISGLTALIFPALYPRLIQGELLAAIALAARNALIALLVARLAWQRPYPFREPPGGW